MWLGSTKKRWFNLDILNPRTRALFEYRGYPGSDANSMCIEGVRDQIDQNATVTNVTVLSFCHGHTIIVVIS